jgi:hypothetical protein
MFEDARLVGDERAPTGKEKRLHLGLESCAVVRETAVEAETEAVARRQKGLKVKGLVATKDGQVHEVFFNSATGVHITQHALATFPGSMAVAGYFTSSDNFQYVIVATNDGQVHEVFFNSAAGVDITQPALATFPGIGRISGYAR